MLDPLLYNPHIVALTPGTHLGPYEILEPIGKGGMGEVYRARDTRLGRDVAIKAAGERFTERFDREARAVAALNHSNVCHLYDVGPNFLVMELVEGSTLAERLKGGALPLDEALAISRQIADALDAAHEKGIVHRDLKPGNVMITPDGTVKVLDFGLAKAADPDLEMSPENSPTLTVRATQAGMILGTAAYMSPEQAAGKKVDKRADIWAFGVVLHETITGRRLFEGDSIAETLAGVIKSAPDLSEVPAQIRPLLDACLEKDPKKRLRDIGDARRLLAVEAVAPSNTRARPLRWMVATAALATVAIGASLGLWAMSRTTRPTDRPLMRFDVDLGPDAASGWPSSVAISPDGTRLVFPVRNTSVRRPRLATRLLDQTTVTHMPGTEGARGVFFSPDSRWIGFFADGKLKKMPVQGGAPIVLCDAPLTFGASWGEDGYVVLSGSTGAGAGLARVSADGGQPEPLSRNQPGEFLQMLPQVFQGGNAVLFSNLASINATSDATIDVLDLKAGVKKTILSGAYFGRYVASAGPLGHLVYIRGEDLFGVGFDPVRLELQGTPELLVQGVGGGSLSQDFGSLTFSQSGIFVYPSGQGTQTYPIVWLDSSGKTTPLLPKPGAYFTPRLSPDGQRLAVTVGSDRGRDIWVYDHARDIMTRLTLDERSRDAIWTPDGKHLLYWTSSPNNSTISVIRADGAGEPQQLLESKNYVVPSSVSPDGRRLLYFEVHPETRQDLWTLPLDVSDSDHFKPGKPEPFLRTPLLEFEPSFSSDGRWIAYRSNESDANTTEVYVRPYPGPGGKWQVSNGGGKGPIWSRNGKELFYETLDGRIMVVDYVTKGEAFEAGRPRQWSDQRILSLGGAFDADLAFDGRRFVVFPPSESNGADRGAVRVTFLVNFFDELRRRLPLAGR